MTTPSNSGLIIIRDYHLESEELQKVYSSLITRLSPLLPDLLIFMDKAFFLLASALENPRITQNKDVRDVLHILLARGMKSHRSIRVLIADGLEQDAMAILRNLVETAITIKYIATDPTGRLAQRFRDYQNVERYKNMEKNRKVDPTWLPPGGAPVVALTEEQYDAFKKRYQVKKVKNWHGLSGIEELASLPEVGMEKDYIQAYSTYCLFTHPSYLSAKEYAFEPDRNSNASWVPTSRRVLSLACMSTGYLLNVAEVYIGHLGVTEASAVNILNEVRVNLLSKKELWTPGASPVEISGGTWGTLPASLQKDLMADKTTDIE